MPRALMHLFPDVDFDPSKFPGARKIASNRWKDISNQKDFFIEFAASKGFDHQDPGSWYPIAPHHIRSFEVFPALLTLRLIYYRMGALFYINTKGAWLKR